MTNKYPGKLTIVFLNALVETLLIKLVDSALYVLFGSYRKTERIQLLAQCYFRTQQALKFAFTPSSERFSTREIEGYTVLFPSELLNQINSDLPEVLYLSLFFPLVEI